MLFICRRDTIFCPVFAKFLSDGQQKNIWIIKALEIKIELIVVRLEISKHDNEIQTYNCSIKLEAVSTTVTFIILKLNTAFTGMFKQINTKMYLWVESIFLCLFLSRARDAFANHTFNPLEYDTGWRGSPTKHADFVLTKILTIIILDFSHLCWWYKKIILSLSSL